MKFIFNGTLDELKKQYTLKPMNITKTLLFTITSQII